jgi:hypothetical protein
MQNTSPTTSECRRGAKLTFLLGILVAAINLHLPAAPTTLVDVTFNGLQPGQAPPFVGDTIPSIPCNKLLKMNFGTALITNDVSGMEGPVARLVAPQGGGLWTYYSQPHVYDSLKIPSNGRRFLFTQDLFLSGFKMWPGVSRSADVYAILFDAPAIRRIDFATSDSGGRISYKIGLAGPKHVGNFEFDKVHKLVVFLDFDRSIWSAWLNGQVLFHNAGFPGSEAGNYLSSLRLSLAHDGEQPHVPLVYIDNIKLLELPASPIVMELPNTFEAECGAPQTVSALVSHWNGSAKNLVWTLDDVPVATNVVSASVPMNYTQVDLDVDLAPGKHDLQLTATDTDGATHLVQSIITVLDKMPPSIAHAAANPAILWPPNGQMVTVKIDGLVEDLCSASDWGIVHVYSNESVLDGTDIELLDNTKVRLRARRSARSENRIYTVHLRAVDEAGNISQLKSVQVIVPHDARKQ